MSGRGTQAPDLVGRGHVERPLSPRRERRAFHGRLATTLPFSQT